MPSRIVSNLQRYCVLSFFEQNKEDKEFLNRHIPKCPLTTTLEVSNIIAPNDTFNNKRLKSFEKHVQYPYVDVTFFSSFMDKRDLAEIVEEEDCVNLHNTGIFMAKGIYEEIQIVDPKRDMVQTPIDEDPFLRVMQEAAENSEYDRRYKGFIINAFKTMEHMDSEEFISSWKTWTGVRYICMHLPRQLGLRRISFYRLINETTPFKYILLIEISNVGLYVPQTLNLLDRLKLKLCGLIGIYRNQDYVIDPLSARVFGKGTLKENTPVPPVEMSVSVPLAGERFLTLSESGLATVTKAPIDKSGKTTSGPFSDDDSEVNILGEKLSQVALTPSPQQTRKQQAEDAATKKTPSVPIISPREKAHERKMMEARATVEARIHAPRASVEEDLLSLASLKRDPSKRRSPIKMLASKLGKSTDGRRKPSARRSPRSAAGPSLVLNLDDTYCDIYHDRHPSGTTKPRLAVNDRPIDILDDVYAKPKPKKYFAA